MTRSTILMACLLAIGCTAPPEKEAHKQPGKDKPRIARLDDAPAPARRISVAPDQLPADQFDGRRITSLLNRAQADELWRLRLG